MSIGSRQAGAKPAAPTAPLLHRLLFQHPSEVGETYAEHAGVAGRFGLAMIVGGIRCLVHAVVPGIQQRAASDTVRSLHRQLEQRRGMSDTDPDYVI